MKRSHFFMTVMTVAGTGAVISAMLFCFYQNNGGSDREDAGIYRDTAARYGTLTAGITRTARLSPGMTRQTFDLDIESSAEVPSPGLQVEEVLVSTGQKVQKGTPLFRLTADSVQGVRAVLQKNILETSRECELLETVQEKLRLQASQAYDSAVVDGKYAGAVYSSRCDALQKKADDAKEAVDRRQDQVNEHLLELTRLQQELVKAQKYLKDAETAVNENYSERYQNAYYYAVYENTRETARQMAARIEDQIESLTEKNEALLYEIDEATRAYHQIVQDLEREKLAAKMAQDTEIYDSKTASERYDIQISSLDSSLQEAEGRYQSALQDIRTFDARIVRGQLLSGYDGVIAEITMEAGDIVGTNDTLVTLYDRDAAAMEVLLSEEEYSDIDQNETAIIMFSEYPDMICEGKITSAGIDPAKACCRVTVTIQGEMPGICGEMAGDVTFLTDEAKDVLYVPRSAVCTDDQQPYVRMRDKKGNIVKKRVMTGISDGIYVEIVKGISEGDIVLAAGV